jgi:heterodisulfide reductase subunit A-like polyferredoxin
MRINANCIGCRACTTVCKHSAIKVEGNKVTIDEVKCQNCGDCLKVCPMEAISLVV